MLKGNLVGLRAVEVKDLEQLTSWRNNQDFRKYFREYKETNSIAQKKWFEEKVLSDPFTMMFSIVKLDDDELIGCCGLVYIQWVYRHADLSLYIGRKDAYIDELGYAKESAELLLNHGFNSLGLNKIWTEIYDFDKKKKKLYDKLGFKVDGVLRENYFFDNKFWNSYVLSILSREWLGR